MHGTMQRTLAAAIAAAALCTTACHHHRHEGPAQHAGREIDHAADKTGDVIEETGHKINRALPGD
jgi:hypothetical protein